MSASFESCAASDVGLVRDKNEDAYLCRDDAGIWAVADGLGGHEAGELASLTVVGSLEHVPAGDLATMRGDVLHALQRANDDLLAMNAKLDFGLSPGSTVAVLLAHADEGMAIWAGDSRIYRLRADEAQRLTRDHSHVQELVDEGLMEPDDVENHPMAHAITRAIGIDPQLDLESAGFDLAPGDRFLLCSDGLSRLLSDVELFRIGRTASPREAVDTLLQQALDRGAPDNVTVVLVECQ